VLACVGGMTFWAVQQPGFDFTNAIRYCAFNVISIITGTGYSTIDYGQWGSFAVAGFFFFMFIGGCAGSTSCGIKVFRFQVLYQTSRGLRWACQRRSACLKSHTIMKVMPR